MSDQQRSPAEIRDEVDEELEQVEEDARATERERLRDMDVAGEGEGDDEDGGD